MAEAASGVKPPAVHAVSRSNGAKPTACIRRCASGATPNALSSAAVGAIRLKPSVLRKRKRDVHPLADLHGTREVRWRHSNERDRHSVHLDGLADNRGIAIEAAFPEAIGDDADRRRRRLIVGNGQH